MTNDERHIAVLNRMLENMDVYDSIQPTTERKKAIKAAIKALEQEPCERFEWSIDGNVYKITKAKDGKKICQQVCNDAISRQAVLDTISELNAISFYEAQEDSKECYYEIRQAVENMPPVTPQQKYGKWIDIPFSHYYKCSECDKYQISATNYCPNCGAKMQAESEEV